MRRIIWKWKANIEDYIGRPGVVGVRVSIAFPKDPSLFGRDGYVGYDEGGDSEDCKKPSVSKGNDSTPSF